MIPPLCPLRWAPLQTSGQKALPSGENNRYSKKAINKPQETGKSAGFGVHFPLVPKPVNRGMGKKEILLPLWGVAEAPLVTERERVYVTTFEQPEITLITHKDEFCVLVQEVDDADHAMYEPNHKTLANDLNQTNSFESTDFLSGIKLKKKDLKTLGPGMVLLKNFISISGQVEIVKTCQEFGKGPGGFYQPALLNLRLMCFGRNWDPQTKYNARYRGDGSEAPPIPDKLVSLVQTSIKDSQAYDSSIPSMNPDICIVNFYATSGRLGLHKDIDESPDSLNKGLPVVSISVEIVKTCQEFGKGPGGFYQPALLNLRLMCFGRNWDPQTKYNARYRGDGSKAPPIPDKLVSLVQTSIKDSQAYDSSIPSMNPDICIVNFYATSGRLGLHKDIDESPDSLNKGLPVVSISVGDSAKFLYGRYRDERKANEVLLKSGDVLIFGGRSRRIYHGVKTIIPNSAPLPLQEIMLGPGRFNLTFRQF
ncbi:Oxoglutarate/iron-dependent dioxygenase [Artemisia annua]|uniref:Oxoglutarate/iron-dependent dioxygenase n=1 Tax=Artemisia annua TaxID=35608 RepID=A0A2U1P280_ARTAN|nr:Oxoglutarate/iron-dependent dioxygenase [Artemisia annua]